MALPLHIFFMQRDPVCHSDVVIYDIISDLLPTLYQYEYKNFVENTGIFSKAHTIKYFRICKITEAWLNNNGFDPDTYPNPSIGYLVTEENKTVKQAVKIRNDKKHQNLQVFDSDWRYRKSFKKIIDLLNDLRIPIEVPKSDPDPNKKIFGIIFNPQEYITNNLYLELKKNESANTLLINVIKCHNQNGEYKIEFITKDGIDIVYVESEADLASTILNNVETRLQQNENEEKIPVNDEKKDLLSPSAAFLQEDAKKEEAAQRRRDKKKRQKKNKKNNHQHEENADNKSPHPPNDPIDEKDAADNSPPPVYDEVIPYDVSHFLRNMFAFVTEYSDSENSDLEEAADEPPLYEEAADEPPLYESEFDSEEEYPAQNLLS